jgi:hypothetical protein
MLHKSVITENHSYSVSSCDTEETMVRGEKRAVNFHNKYII